MSLSTPQLHEYIDKESSIEHRLKLLDYFVAIASTVWAAAAIYYVAVHEYYIGSLCSVGSMTSMLTWVLISRFPNARHFLANLFLLVTIIALSACTAVSVGDFSNASMYFPIVVVLAAQLVGVRVAAVWSICMIAACGLYCLQVGESNAYQHVMQDRFVHNLGTILTALWLSFESEKFFNVRTRTLQELTESLQEKTRLLELAEETAGVGHWRWDLASDQISLSSEARTICEKTSQQVDSELPETLNDFINVWSPNLQKGLSGRFTLAKTQGLDFNEDLSFESQHGLRHVSCRGLCERDGDGNVNGVFGTLRDDTQLRSTTDRLTLKAEQLNKLASFDPLTGLTNRFQFQQQLSSIASNAVATNNQMALLVLDMDGFKEINDTLGHSTGDEVLKVVAQRLETVVRTGDVVSRLGGDEFTVIIREASDKEEVKTVAQRIVDSIATPMVVDGHELQVGVSIGASLCPRDSECPEELFTFADTAMYDAKGAKRGLAMYSMEMTEKLRARRSAENRLAGALGREEFRLVYQPQCNIETGAVFGFEALLRWHNDGDDIPPLKFIPLLEGNGKIVEVGQWVLEKACEQVAAWNKAGLDVNMAVNISPIQFREQNFADRIIDIIQKYDINPKSIELEITEGVLIQDLENTTDKLFRLKSFGTRISVDDFGTGYSSLAYLKHLPIDQLKIDRAFIKDIPTHDDGMIASSIIVLGQSLDMEVLAEGVETQSQLDFLKSQTCHAFQGNLLGKPMSPEDCEILLRKNMAKIAVV